MTQKNLTSDGDLKSKVQHVTSLANRMTSVPGTRVQTAAPTPWGTCLHFYK